MAVIHYNIGKDKHVILANGDSIPESEYDEIRAQDESQGYIDRMFGIYDKWYRLHRSDDGAAYDEGVKRATEEKNCPNEYDVTEGHCGGIQMRAYEFKTENGVRLTRPAHCQEHCRIFWGAVGEIANVTDEMPIDLEHLRETLLKGGYTKAGADFICSLVQLSYDNVG